MIKNIFIQARMASVRYPGKVLAPFRDKPLIRHLIEKAKRVPDINDVVVLTTQDETDDPLVAYLEKIGCLYFRGAHHHVFERFQRALKEYPCDYFVRLCADSPCLNEKIVETMLIETESACYDVVSNVIHKTFPQGQSVEIIKTISFLQIDPGVLSKYESEHVTPFFYQHVDRFKILSIQNKTNQSTFKMSIDSLNDLQTLSANPLKFTFNRDALCKIEC